MRKKGTLSIEIFRKAGRKGGRATANKKDHAFYLEIGKKGGLKRWSNKKKEDTKAIPKSEDGLQKTETV